MAIKFCVETLVLFWMNRPLECCHRQWDRSVSNHQHNHENTHSFSRFENKQTSTGWLMMMMLVGFKYQYPKEWKASQPVATIAYIRSRLLHNHREQREHARGGRKKGRMDFLSGPSNNNRNPWIYPSTQKRSYDAHNHDNTDVGRHLVVGTEARKYSNK